MTTPVAAPASDLSTRLTAAVVMIAVALTAIYVGGWPFRLLVAACAYVMILEWANLTRVSRGWAHLGGLVLVVSQLLLAEQLFPVDEMDEAIGAASFAPAWTSFGISTVLALLLGLATRRASMAGGFLYVAIPVFALLVLNWVWYVIVLWVMVVTWATDIFAYFAGRAIGGPKLAPRISPKKTWAGLIGGVIGATVLGWAFASWFDIGAPFLYIGGAMALIAQAGDLFESWLKRRAGVKDSGSIIPGHGGALDRLDGLLPVTVATFLLLATGQWTG